MNRTYQLGRRDDHPAIIIPGKEQDIPFTVWRDVGRLAGRSQNFVGEDPRVIFWGFGDDSGVVTRAETILLGAMYSKTV